MHVQVDEAGQDVALGRVVRCSGLFQPPYPLVKN